MFESAELGHKVDKKTYEKEVPDLRAALLDAQYDLGKAQTFPVIIIIAGVDGAGKGETVNLLNEWMDPRHIQVHAVDQPNDEERDRPPMWRFWRKLPPRGKTGMFFGSWYTDPILGRVMRQTKKTDLIRSINEIIKFEKMLADEGVLVVKFWFHLSKKQQKQRLKTLEKNPATRYRVTKQDWQRFKLYDRFIEVCSQTLRETSTGNAPWFVVEGSDARYRNLTVGKILLEAIRKRFEQQDDNSKPLVNGPVPLPAIDKLNIVKSLDFSKKLTKKQYENDLAKYQRELNLLLRKPEFSRLSLIAVFEGSDAAGKGGAIRRVTQALDVRQFNIVPIGAPTEEERAQPYLWRFWRHIPKRGKFTIFDRSWFGRVLVERVEGFATESDWMRAYHEINEFEAQLIAYDAIIVKFWLAITKDEQLVRFKEREKIPFKRFKITPDDWRNRKKFKLYDQAVCDMVARTSTEIAPWTLVEANDKRYARIKVLKTLCDGLQEKL